MVQLPRPPRPPAFRPVVRPPIPQMKRPASLSGVVQAGKQRAQAALSKIQGAGPRPGRPLFEEFLETLMAGGEEGEELAQQIVERAKEESNKRRHLCSSLSELLGPFRAPGARIQLVRDVLRPAQSRQLNSQQAWDRVGQFFPLVGDARRVLAFAESRLGPLTIGLGVGVEGGAGAGVEGGIGIAGLRHHCACIFRTATVAIGTYAELQASFQIGVSQGVPEAGRSVGLAIDASLSASYGLAAEITVSVVPVSIKRPSLDRPYLVEYKCVGMGLSLGAGAPGGGCALGLTGTQSFTLVGKAG